MSSTKSLSFNSSYVECISPSGLPDISGAKSISFWTQHDGNSTGQTVLSLTKDNTNTAGNALWITLAFIFGQKTVQTINWGGITLCRAYLGVGQADIASDTWFHIVYTCEAGCANQHIYVNGVEWEFDPETAVSTQTGTVGVVRLGSGNAAFPSPYHNRPIDDVAIYDYTLTSSDALYLYGDGSSGSAGDPMTLSPVLYWPLEEGSGTTTADESGNNNDADLIDDTSWSTDVPDPLAGGSTPTFTATATLTTGSVTLAADATFTKPTYSATAALTIGHTSLATTATFVKPTYTATSTLTVGHVAFTSTATFTKPTYTATAALTTGPTTFAATAIFANAVYQGTAALTVGHVAFTSSATFTKPIYTATASLTTGHTSFTATAIFAAAVFQASATLTTGQVTLSSTATFSAGTETATAVLTVGQVTFTSISTFKFDTAAAVLIVGHADFIGTATFVKPTYTATSTLTIGRTVFAGATLVNKRHLRWTGRTNLVIRWKPIRRIQVTGQMQQYRTPIRIDTPQLLEYTFRDTTGSVIDLTTYLNVKVWVKKQGNAYVELIAQIDDAALGKVKYDAYQFGDEGEWTAQFIAYNFSNKPVYGEPLRMTVAKNLDNLDTDELPSL